MMDRRYHDDDWLESQLYGGGLTPDEIAEKCDVSRQTIKRYLKQADFIEECGAFRDKDGEPCLESAYYPDRRCYRHSDYVKRNTSRNAVTGFHCEDYDRFREAMTEEEIQVAEAFYQSLLDDAPFGEDSEAKCELLRQVSLDLIKRRRGNEYIFSEGMTQQKTAAVAEGTGPIEEPEENVLHITYDRLGRTNIRLLKELGVLEDPDSQQAEAQKSFLEILAENADE